MASIVSKITKDITTLPGILEEYDGLLEQAAPIFNLDGKRLEQLCKEHAQNLSFYDSKLQELKIAEDFIHMKMDEVESRLWRTFNEKYSRALSTRDIQAYIMGEPEYVTMKEIYFEVMNVRKQYESIVEALKDLGWQLSHITKLRVAELEDAVI